jgi:predicted fused transcriptional regulator/phosphomethylpyrimidine kinase
MTAHNNEEAIELLHRASAQLDRDGTAALMGPHVGHALAALLGVAARDMAWVDQRTAEQSRRRRIKRPIEPTASDSVLFRLINVARAITGDEA